MAQEGKFEKGGGTELGCWELSAKKDVMYGIYQIDSHSHPCLPCLAPREILTDGASKLNAQRPHRTLQLKAKRKNRISFKVLAVPFSYQRFGFEI